MTLISAVFAIALASGQAGGVTADAVQEVRRADDAFWAAYNGCDRVTMADAFTENAEFYHDVTGLTRSRGAVVESLMKGPCGTEGQRLRRTIVEGTVQAYSLSDGYVFLTGEHLFHVQRPDQPERVSAHARFADVWRWESGRWRMARVISYNHGPPPYAPPSADADFDRARLPDFAGLYRSEAFGEVILSVEGDGLRLRSGDLSLFLVPVSEVRFAAMERDLQVELQGDTLTILEGGTPVTTGLRVR